MITLPPGIIPVRDLTTRKILYGARTTTHRFELLEHDSSTGMDSLIGYLDGVTQGGRLSWTSGVAVRKSGSLPVLDLAKARPGLLRIGDINLVTTRVRPVRLVEGLPEVPLGVYEMTRTPEDWSGTGRTYQLSLLDKSTVLNQDAVEESFTAGSAVSILSIIQSVVASAGERIDVDASDTRTLASPRSWPAGTSKLKIVNELLKVLEYDGLWVDGAGNFKATPYVPPADRSIQYPVLNGPTGDALVRELVSGEESIYSPDWTRDRDVYGVPNKVIATASRTGDGEPLSGFATNENPASPFSYQARGNRWFVPPEAILDNVEVPDYSGEADPDAAVVAYLQEKARRSLIDQSSVQASVRLSCLPIPIELLEALRFESTPAGINARHTVRSVEIPLRFDGLMDLDLMEVVAL